MKHEGLIIEVIVTNTFTFLDDGSPISRRLGIE